MLGNLILEMTNAPGTGADCNLLGPVAGRLPFAFWFGSGSQCFYVLNDGTQQEWGIGTFTAGSPNKLTRTTVLKNSTGSTARLNFLGTTRVYNDIPAERSLWVDNGGNLTVYGNIYATWLGASRAGGGAVVLNDPAAASDAKTFDFYSSGGTLYGRAANDSETAANPWLTVTRTGAVPALITLTGTSILLNAPVSVGAAPNGYLNFRPESGHPGYIEFFAGAGARKGYAGYDDGALHLLLGNDADFLGWHVLGELVVGQEIKAGDIFVSVPAIGGNEYALFGDSAGRAIEFTSGGWTVVWDAGTGNLTYFNPQGAALFYSVALTGDFHVYGNVVAANVSDERTKRNVAPYTRGLADLIHLRPVTYAYNGLGGTPNTGERRIGLTAQQALPFVPECVFPTPRSPTNPMRDDPPPDPRLPDQLSFDDQPLLYALLNAVRELSERVVALEAAIEASP